MIQAPQVEPISGLRRNHLEIMGKLNKGPIFLSQRGTLAAAIVSIEQWDRMARRMEELELLALHHQRMEEARQAPTSVVSHEELERQLAAKVIG